MARLLCVLACVLLQGCIVVPVTVATYDPECQVASRHMVLQAVQVAAINQCANQGCVVLIVAAAATAVATAIVSGSVVVVGNAAYWAERKSGCQARVPGTGMEGTAAPGS